MKTFHSAFFILILFILLPKTDTLSQSNLSMNKLSDLKSSLNPSNDSLEKKQNTPKFLMKKSPLKAVIYSAILPGAGQFYNRSYWKIPIIAGLGGYFVYEIISNNNRFLDFRDQYFQSQTPENPSGDIRLRTLREFYRDQKDDFFIYSLILYVVNLIDAYVDAELYDFDVSENINLQQFQNSKIIIVNFNF